LNCGKKGHWAKNCCSKPKKGKAHVAQTEEAEESSLFFASVGEIIPNVPDTEQSGDGGNPAEDKDYLGLGVNEASDQKRVEILEERVYAQIGNNGEHRDHRRWILNTGATNHMIGARAAFSELDFRIRGSVKFGDGSVVEIEGKGTILFLGKGGNHRWLTGVYYIP
jgi:hypothetical protein